MVGHRARRGDAMLRGSGAQGLRGSGTNPIRHRTDEPLLRRCLAQREHGVAVGIDVLRAVIAQAHDDRAVARGAATAAPVTVRAPAATTATAARRRVLRDMRRVSLPWSRPSWDDAEAREPSPIEGDRRENRWANARLVS